ncbi:MAG: hypothetical protein DSM106950_25305 [Stigonema ocellatum SAG 48.90 = DSM 106950]|nr:hypothetical protein [Stigonema ocellatum SAG 48.90 = DSM 106950]
MPLSVPQRSETKLTSGQHRSRLASRFAIAVLLSIAGLVAMFAWISILFMFNPEQVGLLNQFLSEWAKIHFGEQH